MTDVMTEVETASVKVDIRPFRFKVSNAELSDFRRRIADDMWHVMTTEPLGGTGGVRRPCS